MDFNRDHIQYVHDVLNEHGHCSKILLNSSRLKHSREKKSYEEISCIRQDCDYPILSVQSYCRVIYSTAHLELDIFRLRGKNRGYSLISKLGKPEIYVSSYRPMSLFRSLSLKKLLENLILNRLYSILSNNHCIIPDHQFSFRSERSTIEPCKRLIGCNLFNVWKRAVFLNVAQAFHKVWYSGLLYKLKYSSFLQNYTSYS